MSKTTEISPPFRYSEITPDALGTLVAAMYKKGKDTVTAQDISEHWPRILRKFAEDSAMTDWSRNNSTLDLNRSSVIQTLTAATSRSMESAETEGLLKSGIMSRLLSHAQARLCRSKVVRDALLTARETASASERIDSVSYREKDIMALFKEVYGPNFASFFSDDTEKLKYLESIGYRTMKYLRQYTDHAYELETGKPMPHLKADREFLLWNTKEGRRSLVKGTRKVMEDLIRHGLVSSGISTTYGSHDAAEKQALESLGLSVAGVSNDV